MAFDVSGFKNGQMDRADVTIVHPVTGESTDMVITVMSMDSDEYRQIQLRLQNEQIKYARKNRGKTTAERIQQEALDLLVAVTVGWKGIEKDGAPYPFTPDNARWLYASLPFVKEQVDEFIGERRNFIRS